MTASTSRVPFMPAARQRRAPAAPCGPRLVSSYAGAEAQEDRGEMFVQNAKLDAAIVANLREIGYGG